MGLIMRTSLRLTRHLAALAAGAALFVGPFARVALADGYPVPGQINFEEAVTPVAHEIHWFHNDILLPISVLITLFVGALLAIVIFRFNERANPVPSTTTHHTGLEIAWTIIPVVILFAIVIPSMNLLTHELVVPKSDMTIKVTGKQWFWSYEYPADEGGGFSIDSLLLKGDDLKPGMMRQLAVDNEVVVPVNKNVHLLVTGADVIHSFVVPSFGTRVDAVPGRMNETWFRAEKTGVYYGQCSKLCGKDHAYMPIVFHVMTQKDYDAWLQTAKKNFAATESQSRIKLAGAQ
jgi:cytochrome c oxidase subunit 2